MREMWPDWRARGIRSRPGDGPWIDSSPPWSLRAHSDEAALQQTGGFARKAEREKGPVVRYESAINYYHDPAQRARSLGNVRHLSLVAAAPERGLRHTSSSGTDVAGCRSSEYKVVLPERITPAGWSMGGV